MPETGGRASRKPVGAFSGTRQGVGQGDRFGPFYALNLSCFQEKQSVSNGKAVFVRRTTPPRPSPARGASRPLSSGVQAGGALRFLRLPPRLEALAVPVASRVRLRPRPHPFGARRAGCAPRAASGRALDTPSTRKPGPARDRLHVLRSRPGVVFRVIMVRGKNNNSIIIILITTKTRP